MAPRRRGPFASVCLSGDEQRSERNHRFFAPLPLEERGWGRGCPRVSEGCGSRTEAPPLRPSPQGGGGAGRWSRESVKRSLAPRRRDLLASIFLSGDEQRSEWDRRFFCSPPPCGEGLGEGVSAGERRVRFTNRRTPTPALPSRGRGAGRWSRERVKRSWAPRRRGPFASVCLSGGRGAGYKEHGQAMRKAAISCSWTAKSFWG